MMFLHASWLLVLNMLPFHPSDLIMIPDFGGEAAKQMQKMHMSHMCRCILCCAHWLSYIPIYFIYILIYIPSGKLTC